MWLRRSNRMMAPPRGFTLIELLVVIAILGILAGVVSFGVIRYVDDARVTRAKLEIDKFKSAVKMHYIDTGRYPSAEEGLRGLIEKPGDENVARSWKGPYLEDVEDVPLDPWKNEYIYMVPGSGNAAFEIISLGKDGAQGGDGNNADISSRRLGE
jgi:general secretion pathway protein G